MKRKILGFIASFLATFVVIIGTLLVVFAFKKEISITSFIAAFLGFSLLYGATQQWENRFKSLFKIDNDKEV